MHSKIKILFFCDNKWGGGILTYLYNLISGLDRDIFEITLVCSKPETGSIYMIDEIKKLGVEVIPYEHLRFIALFFGVLKFFFKKRFDIFSLHTWSHELVLASKLAMVKLVIFHPHEYYYLKINKLRRRLIDKLARHCLDAIVVPSKLNIPPIVKAYRIPSSRLFVIPHGINTQVFIKKYDKQYYRRKTNLDCPHCLIGTVALLSEIKGYPYLLEAIAILKKKGVWLKLVIAGDTRPQLSTAARLKTISNTLGIKDDIVFLGFRRDVVDILGAIDIFVLPSLEELFGLAILEAMAMSKPIIATNTGGGSRINHR